MYTVRSACELRQPVLYNCYLSGNFFMKRHLLIIIVLLLHVMVLKSEDRKADFFGISPTFSTFIDEDELAYYKEMGLQTIRIHLQQKHEFQEYDAIIETCNKLGIDVMMLVSYESYPSTSEPYEQPWGWIEHYTNSMELLTALDEAVPYFRDRGVHSWEIWNEENGVWFLHPHEYALLLDSVYSKFKYTDKWDPTATIVFGGIDAVGAFHPQHTNPAAREWVQDLFATREWADFYSRHQHYPYDVMSIHPYYTYTEENFYYNIDDVVLNTMNAYGDTLKPIWITELGTKKSDPEINADILENYVRASYKHPRIERFFQFKYTYFGTPETTADHNYFSLVQRDTDSSPREYKPGWYRYNELAMELNTGPDLLVDSIWLVPENPFVGDSIEIFALVKNSGDTATTDSSIVFFEIDGNPENSGSTILPNLNVGEAAIVKMDMSYETPQLPFNIEVFADYLNQIEEKNEANNFTEKLVSSSNVSLSYKGGNSDSLNFKIELEDYDIAGSGFSYNDHTPGNEGGEYRNDDVDISALPEGGYNVGWIWPDEWLNYSDIKGADTSYQVYARVASINNDNRFRLEMDGNKLSETLAFSSTNGWGNFVVVSLGMLTLPKGKHTIKFDAESDLFNIDYIHFTASDYSDEYCQSRGDNDTTNSVYLDQISLGDFQHVSGDDMGYGDFTSSRIDLITSNPVNFSFVQGSRGGASLSCRWNVWIDYNQNQIFETDEKIINNKSGVDISGELTIPQSAMEGESRMRVSMKSGGLAAQACELFGIGEVEDYTVHIVKSTVGIFDREEYSSEEGMKIKQPIANEILEISFSEGVSGQIRLINMQGAVIHQEAVQEMHHEMDVSHLSSGVYLVIFKGEGEFDSRKFIKQ